MLNRLHARTTKSILYTVHYNLTAANTFQDDHLQFKTTFLKVKSQLHWLKNMSSHFVQCSPHTTLVIVT